MTKEECFANPVWELYPQLRHLATHMLSDEETENLLTVLLAGKPEALLVDNLSLDMAMFWCETPQGDAYWRGIHRRITCLPMPEYDPDAPVDHGQTVGETKAGWQPDIVDGASVMDITRSLF